MSASRISAALITLALMLLACASSLGVNVTISGQPSYGMHYRWLNSARTPVPDHVHLHRQACPEDPHSSCVHHGSDYVWLHPGSWSDRHVFMHEVGHLYGFERPDLVWGQYERWTDVYAHCAIFGVGPVNQKVVWIYGNYLARINGDLYRKTCRRIKYS